jgi:hypothetical protein
MSVIRLNAKPPLNVVEQKVDVFDLAGAIDVSPAPFEISQCRERNSVPC